jgi:hypothetical protein
MTYPILPSPATLAADTPQAAGDRLRTITGTGPVVVRPAPPRGPVDRWLAEAER